LRLPPQAKLHLSFQDEALGPNGPFLVHAQLATAEWQLSGGALAGVPPPLRASGCGQSKQKGRQQASAALLELLLQVRGGAAWGGLRLLLCGLGPSSACCHGQGTSAVQHTPALPRISLHRPASACIGMPAGTPVGAHLRVLAHTASGRAARPPNHSNEI
jgi:hypothetical protein